MKSVFRVFVLLGLLILLPSCAAEPNPKVKIKTSMGDMTVELYADKAPQTVKNFLKYVDNKHYDGTIFHRVISDFMIQGGGFTPDMTEKPTDNPIQNESANGLANERGTLAMARTGEPHSATSQFFINVKKNDFLDRANAQDRWGYCVFGKVIDGMDVVDKIRQVETETKNFHENVPVETVTIESIRRLEPAKDE